MLSFEEAGRALDGYADALPGEIFQGLTGGVNLLPAKRMDSDGFFVMGMHISDVTGHRVEIYYGSFKEAFRNASDEKIRRELKKTLYHELTHHIEHMAGDKTLERWDERQREKMLAQLACCDVLETDSILFICADNAGLSPLAESIFNLKAKDVEPPISCASAGLSADPPPVVCANAALAASRHGADISRHVPRRVTRELLKEYDAVLCMTEEQGDELAWEFPEFDDKILTLGAEDVLPPKRDKLPLWLRAAANITKEIDLLLNELCSEGEYD